MLDCYDTRFLSQRTIEAIIEIWDSADHLSWRVSGTERGAQGDATGVSLAGEKSECRDSALLVKPEQS